MPHIHVPSLDDHRVFSIWQLRVAVEQANSIFGMTIKLMTASMIGQVAKDAQKNCRFLARGRCVKAYMVEDSRDQQITTAASRVLLQSSFLQLCRHSLLSLLLH